MANKTMKTLTIGDNKYEIVDEAARSSVAAKQATITGAATTITSNNLTTNRALISNSSGKVAVSDVTSTEIGYLDGVTSNVQTQLNNKADNQHTHNYAGSSSAGGAAVSANKINTDAGSTTQPVYFSNGVPVKTTYTLGKSVPSDAKFTDTTYSEATTSAAGLMSSSDKTKLNGVATGATKNTVVDYSATLSSGGWSDSAPYTQTVTVSGILATDKPIVDVDMSGATTASAGANLLIAWGCVGRISTAANSITAYCYEDKPTVNIPIQIKAVR